METGDSKEKKETLTVASLASPASPRQDRRACREAQVWWARRGKPLSGPRDPQVLLACLGHLALGDLVPLGHQDPRDHQDLQLS